MRKEIINLGNKLFEYTTWDLDIDRYLKHKKIRCYMIKVSDSAWFAGCITLNLVACDKTKLRVRKSLNSNISTYMKIVLDKTLKPEDLKESNWKGLLNRKVPLFMYWEYIIALLYGNTWRY